MSEQLTEDSGRGEGLPASIEEEGRTLEEKLDETVARGLRAYAMVAVLYDRLPRLIAQLEGRDEAEIVRELDDAQEATYRKVRQLLGLD
ncbi:MAG: hypothetical protein M3220_11925 [Chloroflexota bacterium]|nr:hypothetical protein [Chloroflexota bacterium]